MKMQKVICISCIIIIMLNLAVMTRVMGTFILPFTDLLVQQLLTPLGSAAIGGLGRLLALSYTRE